MILSQMLMLLNVLNLPTCPTGFALLQLCKVVFALIVLTQPSKSILWSQTLRLPDSRPNFEAPVTCALTRQALGNLVQHASHPCHLGGLVIKLVSAST